jgi:sulfite exporter TauE/SafE/copper chaperone CopZ
MSQSLTFHVTGMTCHNCERMITETLNAVPGVHDVHMSLRKSCATVHLNDGAEEPRLEDLNKLLVAHGYALIREGDTDACAVPQTEPLAKRLRRGIFAILAVAVLILLLRPFRALLPDVSASASIGAMIAFGAVSSLSTCLASTGGYLLAYHGTSQSKRQRLFVHAGRLATFIIGGAVLGLIGGRIPAFSESAYGILALVLGIGFLLVGLNLLDLAPSPAKLGLTLPSLLQKWADRVAASDGRLAPFVVGAVTFVLPCGFTQTAQALALASGSPLKGALMLGAFALGTLPVLAGISFVGGATRASPLHGTLRLASGAILVLFAFGQVDGGLTVLGSPITPGSIIASFASKTSEAAIPAANAQEQVVNMTVAYGTYQPKNLTVRKGIPVRWQIDGKDISGCASSIVVPTFGIKKNLTTGLNVVQFTPKQAGTIPFSCGMGMIRGSFTVTD